MKKGRLTAVGSGISVSGQMTIVTQNHIRNADVVYAVLPNKPGFEYIRSLNQNVHSLTDFYSQGKPRAQTYQEMFTRIVTEVEDGQAVCAVFYGHPGVFVDPSHQAIKYLSKKGYAVHMEPGISAEDCLIADLGIDPAADGCQSYEATQFLFRHYTIDPHMTQIIWQAFCVGEFVSYEKFYNLKALKLLIQKLKRFFPPSHEVIIYEAKISALMTSRIERCTLSTLSKAKLNAISTLVIPSIGLPEYDESILNKLGVSPEAFEV